MVRSLNRGSDATWRVPRSRGRSPWGRTRRGGAQGLSLNSQIWWPLETGRHLGRVRPWCLAWARPPRPALPSLAVPCHLAGHPASLSMQRIRLGLLEVPSAPYHAQGPARVGTLARLGLSSGKRHAFSSRVFGQAEPVRGAAVCTPSKAVSLPGGEARPLNTAPRGQAQRHVRRALGLLRGGREALAAPPPHSGRRRPLLIICTLII